jgi:hypothetical protein
MTVCSESMQSTGSIFAKQVMDLTALTVVYDPLDFAIPVEEYQAIQQA